MSAMLDAINDLRNRWDIPQGGTDIMGIESPNETKTHDPVRGRDCEDIGIAILTAWNGAAQMDARATAGTVE